MRSRELLAVLPPEFAQWTPLAQDQYLEIRTLLVGLPAVLAGRSHADGALGRGPLSVPRRATWSRSRTRCRAAYKLRVLDEKHVLKRAAAGACPPEILGAQEAAVPRARRALLRRPGRARLDRRVLSATRASRDAGVFEPERGRAAAGASAARRRSRRRNSPTPTTWRWSACSRRSCCTSSSSRAVPERSTRFSDRRHRLANTG